LWNREQIAEGIKLVEHALASRRLGPYTVLAAISALHGEAPSSAATDWSEIVGLYDLLLRIELSPVVELNRAVAIAMRDGPEAGLSQIEGLAGDGGTGQLPASALGQSGAVPEGRPDERSKRFFRVGFSTHQPGAAAAVPRKAAGRKEILLKAAVDFAGFP